MFAGRHICTPRAFLSRGRDAAQGAPGSPGRPATPHEPCPLGVARAVSRAGLVYGKGLGARARGRGAPVLQAAAQ